MIIQNDQQFYITTESKLLYNNCFLYDIRSCNFRILQKLGYTSLVDVFQSQDKSERLIKFGHLSKYHKSLLTEVNSITTQIIRKFIYNKRISNDDIIFVQKDGLLIKRFVTVSSEEITKDLFPELQHVISYIIFSSDKRQYMYKCEKTNRIILKGAPNKSIGIDDFLTKKLWNIDIYNFNQINIFINDFFNCYDIPVFTIPVTQSKYHIIMQDGVLELDKHMIKSMSINHNKINKHYYFTTYLEPILRSLLVTAL